GLAAGASARRPSCSPPTPLARGQRRKLLTMEPVAGYSADLALIHHQAFGDLALAAAGDLTRFLARSGGGDPLVVDLGCGSGILLFDVATPGQMQSRGRRTYSEGDGWVVLIDRQEDRRRGILVRRLTVFREREGGWHRSQENHNLRLYDVDQISADLRAAG